MTFTGYRREEGDKIMGETERDCRPDKDVGEDPDPPGDEPGKGGDEFLCIGIRPALCRKICPEFGHAHCREDRYGAGDEDGKDQRRAGNARNNPGDDEYAGADDRPDAKGRGAKETDLPLQPVARVIWLHNPDTGSYIPWNIGIARDRHIRSVSSGR